MTDHTNYLEQSVQGRYVTMDKLQTSWLIGLKKCTIRDIGTSVRGNVIKSITLGHGAKKILMWSQMHGNESTTTKAILDVINFLEEDNGLGHTILDHCVLCIIPILNPDGAVSYTRVNANRVDLNRDAQQRTQPESRILRSVFEEFKPDFCFNLHDQRSLFSAGTVKKPATVSFLSPSSNEEREVTPSREVAMRLIVAMEKRLQLLIPGQIGRYDDAFNANCVGDTFQMLGVPTILFEAGHFPGDYERERTREFIFHALLESLETIATNRIDRYGMVDYFKIPENQKLYYDVLIKNGHIINPDLNPEHQMGIRFLEVLKEGKVRFVPELIDVKILTGHYGHETFDCLNPTDLRALNSRAEIIALLQSDKK